MELGLSDDSGRPLFLLPGDRGTPVFCSPGSRSILVFLPPGDRISALRRLRNPGFPPDRTAPEPNRRNRTLRPPRFSIAILRFETCNYTIFSYLCLPENRPGGPRMDKPRKSRLDHRPLLPPNGP